VSPLRRRCAKPGCLLYAEPGKYRCRAHYLEQRRGYDRRRQTQHARPDRTSQFRKQAKQIIARSPRCIYCGSTQDLTVDHKTPWSKGGSNSKDNLVVACRRCNGRKGAR
jgi:5-methylcytosine-specific restriction endonuclease McrA